MGFPQVQPVDKTAQDLATPFPTMRRQASLDLAMVATLLEYRHFWRVSAPGGSFMPSRSGRKSTCSIAITSDGRRKKPTSRRKPAWPLASRLAALPYRLHSGARPSTVRASCSVSRVE